MEKIFDFIDIYRNPVIGILILVIIILLVALLDSVKKARSKKYRRESLDNLSKSFENINLDKNIQDFIDYTENPAPTLLLIAEIYSSAGNNEQAIAIYRILNKHTKSLKQKAEILESLGTCYYKSGFLERAKEIFTEILRYYPYNINALKHYMYICENLKQYDKALEALGCIEEQSNELDSESSKDGGLEFRKTKRFHTKNYLRTMKIMSNSRMDMARKNAELLEIYSLDSSLHRLILGHFRIYDRDVFWHKILQIADVYPYIDILWYFQKEEVPSSLWEGYEDEAQKQDSGQKKDSIESKLYTNILNIYRAKGYVSGYKKIDSFALEILQLLHLHSDIKGELEFIYQCVVCNANTPFYTYRCQECNEINAIRLRIKPIKFI